VVVVELDSWFAADVAHASAAAAAVSVSRNLPEPRVVINHFEFFSIHDTFLCLLAVFILFPFGEVYDHPIKFCIRGFNNFNARQFGNVKLEKDVTNSLFFYICEYFRYTQAERHFILEEFF
jgi:hypothetical protein